MSLGAGRPRRAWRSGWTHWTWRARETWRTRGEAKRTLVCCISTGHKRNYWARVNTVCGLGWVLWVLYYTCRCGYRCECRCGCGCIGMVNTTRLTWGTRWPWRTRVAPRTFLPWFSRGSALAWTHRYCRYRWRSRWGGRCPWYWRCSRCSWGWGGWPWHWRCSRGSWGWGGWTRSCWRRAWRGSCAWWWSSAWSWCCGNTWWLRACCQNINFVPIRNCFCWACTTLLPPSHQCVIGLSLFKKFDHRS